jgi:hypothetical protein
MPCAGPLEAPTALIDADVDALIQAQQSGEWN